MNRETRKRNTILKEKKARVLLYYEAKHGSRKAENIYRRIQEIHEHIDDLDEILKPPPTEQRYLRKGRHTDNPLNFMTREFKAELEAEKRLLVSMTLRSGSPKRYLAELHQRQRNERKS